MCLALPAKVTTMHDDGTATVELGGVRQRVSMALVDGVSAGDYVVVHVGYALARLDEAEAERTLALLAGAAREGAPPPTLPTGAVPRGMEAMR